MLCKLRIHREKSGKNLLQCLKVIHKSGLNFTPEAGLQVTHQDEKSVIKRAGSVKQWSGGACCSAYLIIPGLQHLEAPLTLFQDNEVTQLLEEPSWWPMKCYLSHK